MTLDDLSGRKVLVVASTGGHLTQAVRWANRLAIRDDSIFLTFDTPQSRSLLAERRNHFLPYVPPRGGKEIASAALKILQISKIERPEAVLSTGAGVALAALLAAARKQVPYIYIESVSRFDGPSLTGRILEHVPFVNLYSQHSGYRSKRWQDAPSLLDEFSVAETNSGREGLGLRIFVTLGTIRPYRQDRLVDHILPLLSERDQVVWQLGVTNRTDVPGEAYAEISAESFDAECREADVVITHAGVGSLMRMLELGRRPVVMPREVRYSEHTDDHQLQVARELDRRNLIALLSTIGSRTELVDCIGYTVSSFENPET